MPSKSKLSLSLRDFHQCLEASSSSSQGISADTNGNFKAWTEKKDWSKGSSDDLLLHELSSSFNGCVQLYGEDIVNIVLADCGGDKRAAVDVLNMQSDFVTSPSQQSKDAQSSTYDQEAPLVLSEQLDELRSEGDGWIQVKLRKRCERGSNVQPSESSARQSLELCHMFYVARRAYFSKASIAWSSGDRRLAGELSSKGKAYASVARERHVDYLDSQLVNFTKQGGRDSVFTLDLHLLFEWEAITLLEYVMNVLLSLDKASTLVVVTGRGNRSLATNGRGVLLVAVGKYLESLSFEYTVEGNGGSIKCRLRI